MPVHTPAPHDQPIKCNGIAVKNADDGKVVISFQMDGIDVLTMPPVYLKVNETQRVGNIAIEIPPAVPLLWRRG